MVLAFLNSESRIDRPGPERAHRVLDGVHFGKRGGRVDFGCTQAKIGQSQNRAEYAESRPGQFDGGLLSAFGMRI